MKKNTKYVQLLIILIGLMFLHTRAYSQRTPGDSLLNFINANKTRASFYLVKNDDPLAALNADKPMQLAQVTNIMIAVAFAQQATNGTFDENAFVPISDIDKYYMPILDSVAQTNWLQDENDQQNIRNDSVSLMEIARGMVMYNSNANAEYLLDILGLDDVENNIQLFGLKHHSGIFPLPSSLFIYQNQKNYTQKALLKKIRNMSNKQYCKLTYVDHESLKNDTGYKSTFVAKDFTTKMQKLWSSKLSTCTIGDYINVCSALNDRKLFTDVTYQILEEILESYMENPDMQKVFKHVGMISGSTPYVFTKLVYGTTIDNKRVEMAYFFNNLTPDESKNISRWSDDFDYKMLTNNRFRLKVAYILSPD
ncbi:MAG TPA: serine hydrolase [Ferruginibacter sp.]|nr:serine hydrolase [Ferruginibacter sp.]